MRRFFMLAVALTSAALSSFGCDSDDSGGSNNGGSGGAPLAHCVGINSEFTPADFYAQAADDKACSSSSDLTSICANDLPRIGGMCGASCVTMSADAAGRAACNAECINDALTSAKAKPLSDEIGRAHV